MDFARVAALLAPAGIVLPGAGLPRAVGGGDISRCWRAESTAGPLFLKTGPAGDAEAFRAEAEGLQQLAATRTLRVPRVLACEADRQVACLAMEWLKLERAGSAAGETLGRELAAMHRHTAETFGWHRDNRIGLTPQYNGAMTSWADFYRERRLIVQLELAAQNGYGRELGGIGGRLLDRLPAIFEGHAPVASLLHGDLWGGNWSVCEGRPVVFDPAVYYGDRETDLAMTRLFGGFDAAFYRAYAAEWPLPEGHEQRVSLYQLYHVLNHLNLFGRGYLGRAVALIESLL